jgi:hypothetical protein
MPLTVGAAFCYLHSNVRQSRVGAIALDQILFSILASAPGLLAGQANHCARIFAELE